MPKHLKLLTAFLLTLLAISIGVKAKINSENSAPADKEFYIIHEIDNGVYHNRVAKEISEAKKGDRITVYINSPGGDADVGIRISKAIKGSQAEVTCKVRKLAASAAAVILASCHKVQIPDDAFILFHTVRLFDILGHPIFSDDPSLPEDVRKVMIAYVVQAKNMMAPVLTQWQIRAIVFYNLDIWMSGQQYKEQLCKLKNICGWNGKILK